MTLSEKWQQICRAHHANIAKQYDGPSLPESPHFWLSQNVGIQLLADVPTGLGTRMKPL